MSLSGGITATQDLVSSFAAANNPTDLSVFSLSVGVVDSALVQVGTTNSSGSFEADFDQVASESGTNPVFVLVRIEAEKWLLVQYVPDTASVRDKMLYASSKAALIRDLGALYFVDSMHVSSKQEFSFKGYKAHLAHKQAASPLTEKELELQSLKLTETTADIGISTRKEIASGVGFAFSKDAEDAFGQLNNNVLNLVALSIDTATETLVLSTTSASATPSTLQTLLPESEPLFVFYKNASPQGTLFFYICPPSAKVKSRMLFSSSRATTLEHVEKNLAVEIGKKIELDSASEIDDALVLEAIEPPKADVLASAKSAFKKPSRPGKK
ncbi:Twinfilin-1 [Rhizoclosmatium sp. JEL0117]|nr:Twinfilin-1 [Rhizoclosmatium sp. JEL0117]